MSVAVCETPARGARNGLPVRLYRYQGTGEDVLTAFMDDEPDEPLPPAGRELAPCPGDGAVRRHYRNGEPLCEPCRQYESRRIAERAAADLASGKTVRAVHAARGGRAWCGAHHVIGDIVIAEPGQEVTCRRCLRAREGA